MSDPLWFVFLHVCAHGGFYQTIKDTVNFIPWPVRPLTVTWSSVLGLGDSSAGKCLLHQHEAMSWIIGTHVRSQAGSHGAYWPAGLAWSVSLRSSDMLWLEGKQLLSKRHLRLTSGLYICMHTCACIPPPHSYAEGIVIAIIHFCSKYGCSICRI